MSLVAVGLIGLLVVGYLAFTAGDGTTRQPATQLSPTQDTVPTSGSARQNDQTNSTTITMIDTSFQPSEVTIRQGETIMWENEEAVLHTVTIPELNIDEDVEPGRNFFYTFDEPGTYDLNCTIHAGMDGEITVESASAMEIETDATTETDTDTNLDTNQNTSNGLY